MPQTILVVDDSISIRKMVTSALRYKGYEVTGVANGQAALEALMQEHYALVILDVNMPQMDGLSLLKIIRKRPDWSDVAILMLTTESQYEDIERALALGANAYMVKPFMPARLLEQVAALLPAPQP